MVDEQERDQDRAVYIISVAAELAGVHPQTLRIYERKGLVAPKRTSGNTRRYSDRDIALLRQIQDLTQEGGINLAGVKMIIELQAKLDALRAETDELQERLREREAEFDAYGTGSRCATCRAGSRTGSHGCCPSGAIDGRCETWPFPAAARGRTGEVAEWFKAPVLKTGVGASLPWVRIPPSPPRLKKRARWQLLWQMRPSSPRPMFNRDFSNPAPLRLLWRPPGSFRRTLHPHICCTSRRTDTFRERPSRR